ncbi:MAG: DUF1501 domain-containing protein [Planctomycetes bacterium]|nr:DUF1501 domain-containing protein [Planctomycetota bacterium]
MNRLDTPRFINRRQILKGTAAGALSATLASSGAAADRPTAKSVIFVFLTGGISHIDTFDMKPEAPDGIRGEFGSIATRTPGVQVCEHLPLLAQRSEMWSQLRSMATDSSGHEPACHMMLTGRRDLPIGFSVNDSPSPNEWPTIPSVITYSLRNTKLPPAAVLPEPSVNEAGRVRPGQYAGRMGSQWEAWHIDIAAKCPLGNGACPDCFRFEGTPFEHAANAIYDVPVLSLPEGGHSRFAGRVGLLDYIHQQQRSLVRRSEVGKFDRQRRQAVNVLTDPKTSSAFDIENADQATQERYGKNKFGLSLLMAKRLVEAGVKYVQVNLGKNSSWDTHRRNFVNLKDNLLPPMDRGMSAMLDDLTESGLIDDTLVIMTGEFGRTPKINKDAGRDHWGPTNTVLFAGGGVQGGRVLGATDHIAGEVTDFRQTPENLSATMYEALGIPRDAHWADVDGRPHAVYHGVPITGLT